MHARHHTSTPDSAHGIGTRTAQATASGDVADPAASPTSEDRLQRVRELAYGLFLERGCGEGHALDDWLLAESKLAAMERSDGTPSVDGTH